MGRTCSSIEVAIPVRVVRKHARWFTAKGSIEQPQALATFNTHLCILCAIQYTGLPFWVQLKTCSSTQKVT